MAFTAAELASIANSALDYYLNKGETFKQSIQQKPLLDIMERKRKTFPGGKGDISLGIKGTYGAGGTNDTLAGFTHNDTVAFYTPSNVDRANFPWREHHLGLTLTHTELKIDGISVVDTNGAETRNHSKREMTMLVNLLNDKMEDLGEQYARSMNTLLWGDGTADAKALAGLRSIVVDIPTLGTVGGIDASVASKSWWRNRARTAAFAGDASFDATYGGNKVTSSPTNGGALLQVLQFEHRQLRRYGGKPDVFLAGSDFIDAAEIEMRANGYYNQDGMSGRQEGAVGDLFFKGVPIRYDPELDDLGRSKFGYWFDSRHIALMAMQDEWRRQHTPARPADQFVLYRSLTCTGQMITQQRNSSLVIEIN